MLQGNIEVFNSLIYGIRQKFWKNFDKLNLNFMRNMNGLKNLMSTKTWGIYFQERKPVIFIKIEYIL